eukprot:12408463-Karenia_brevis.AAC.1
MLYNWLCVLRLSLATDVPEAPRWAARGCTPLFSERQRHGFALVQRGRGVQGRFVQTAVSLRYAQESSSSAF